VIRISLDVRKATLLTVICSSSTSLLVILGLVSVECFSALLTWGGGGEGEGGRARVPQPLVASNRSPRAEGLLA